MKNKVKIEIYKFLYSDYYHMDIYIFDNVNKKYYLVLQEGITCASTGFEGWNLYDGHFKKLEMFELLFSKNDKDIVTTYLINVFYKKYKNSLKLIINDIFEQLNFMFNINLGVKEEF